MTDELCLHCERRPRTSPLGLCVRCQAASAIRVLYVRRANWSPEWEVHLRRLAARAKARLPLFDVPLQPTTVEKPCA